MRRNGHYGEAQAGEGKAERTSSRSGWLGGLLTLVGGVGIGAGLLYILDPDKGKKRRNQILSGAGDLASRHHRVSDRGGAGSAG